MKYSYSSSTGAMVLQRGGELLLTWDESGDSGWLSAGERKDRAMSMVDDMLRIAVLGQPQPDELERFVRQVWTLLNGVVEANDDAVWADDTTTIHEAFIEVVNEYRPKLAGELIRELEQ